MSASRTAVIEASKSSAVVVWVPIVIVNVPSKAFVIVIVWKASEAVWPASIVMPRPSTVVVVSTPTFCCASPVSSMFTSSSSASPASSSSAPMPLTVPPVAGARLPTLRTSLPLPLVIWVCPAIVRTLTVSAPPHVSSVVCVVCVETIVKVSPPEPRSMFRCSSVA